MLKHFLIGALALASFPESQAAAATVILTFNGRNCGTETQTVQCGTNQSVLQSYGDGEGVDVFYRAITGADVVIGDGLEYRATGSGDLSGALFSNTGVGAAGEVFFQALRGYELTLLGFDSGCRNNAVNCRNLPYRITEIGGAIAASGAVANPIGGHGSVTFAIPYSSEGYVLRFGPDGFNGAIDNIAFDVRALPAVPEPSSWALLIAGFGAVGGALRRQRKTRVALIPLAA